MERHLARETGATYTQEFFFGRSAEGKTREAGKPSFTQKTTNKMKISRQVGKRLINTHNHLRAFHPGQPGVSWYQKVGGRNTMQWTNGHHTVDELRVTAGGTEAARQPGPLR